MLLNVFHLSEIHFHESGPSKTMVQSVRICWGYLQYGVVIQRIVAQNGLPSVRTSRMMKLKIEFAKKKSLSTIRSTETIPIA